MELAGRVFLDGFHSPPVLYQRGQVLRDRQAPQVPHQHDQESGGHHVGQHVARSCRNILPSYLLWLVHHQGPQDTAQRVPV